MDMNFCRRCGSKLTHIENHIYKCEEGHTIYANAAPATAAFLVNDTNEVLVTVRAIDPGKGKLDVPGGFLDGTETLEQALSRELSEELGLSPEQYSKPEYLYSGIDNYAFGQETVVVMCAFFWARLNSNAGLSAKDDVASIQFIPLSTLHSTDFVFDSIPHGVSKLQKVLL